MPSGFDDMSLAPIPAGVDPDLLGLEPDHRGDSSRIHRARNLEGCRVRNRAGEDLGTIEDLMIDIPTARVAYAVLSFGGLLGFGNKLFAVPWQALTLHPAEREFVLNVSRGLLENAPGFDKNNWPDMADPEFITRIYGYYGYQPYLDVEDDEP